MNTKFTKKQKIFAVVFVCFIVVLWVTVYSIRTAMLNKQFEGNLSDDFITQLNGIAVQNVVVHLDNNKDIGLQDILDTDLKSGDVVDVTVEYDDESTAEKQAYISVNTDETEVLVMYTDGDYGQIKLPAIDVMTPQEFKEKLVQEKSK